MKNIKTKIIVYAIIPIIALEIVYISLGSFLVQRIFINKFETENIQRTVSLSDRIRDLILIENKTDLTAALFKEKYINSDIVYLNVLSEKNGIIADTELKNGNNRDFSIEFSKNFEGDVKLKVFKEEDKKLMIVSKNVFVGIYKIGSITVIYDLTKLQTQINRSLALFIGLGSLILIGVLLSALRLSNFIVSPMLHIISVANNYAAGNFKQRIQGNSINEINSLANTLNLMASNIVKAEREIKNKEKKMQQKMNELEEWQKLTINRELKMRELKERIK